MGITAAAHALASATDVVITSHRNPDGDGIGAALALRLALRARGAKVRVLLPDPPPKGLDFLPGLHDHRVIANETAARRCPPAQLLISVDCGDLERLGPVAALRREALLNIDHHASNERFGDIAYVDTGAACTTMLVERLLRRLEHPIDAEIAACCYTGLVFDTGRFMHPNTDARSFRFAARLLATGLDAAAINRALSYNLSDDDLKARRIGLERLTRDRQDRRLAGIALSRADMRKAATVDDWGELVEIPRSLAGVEVAYVLREKRAGEVRCSLRANPPFEVGGVAASFGGGGHPQAAGCTIEATLPTAKRKITAALRAALR